MSECTHNCSTCGENCSSRNTPQSLLEPVNSLSTVGKVYAVVSGKGGVGKSTVTSLLSVMTAKKGFKTAVLDADITGPSIPKMLGINERAFLPQRSFSRRTGSSATWWKTPSADFGWKVTPTPSCTTTGNTIWTKPSRSRGWMRSLPSSGRNTRPSSRKRSRSSKFPYRN